MHRRQLLAVVAAGGVAGCLGYTIEQEDDIEEMEETIEELQDDINELENEIDELEAQITEKESTIETLEGENQDLEVDLATKSDELDDLNEKLDTKRDELADIEELTDEQEAEIEDLEAEIEEIVPEHDFSESELDAAAEVIEDIREAVTFVWDAWSFGSAFYTGDEYVTAFHVTRDAWYWAGGVWGEDTRGSEWEFSLGDYDVDIDTQILTTDHIAPDSIKITNYTEPDEGDAIVMVGHPFNVGDWVGSVGRFQEVNTDPGLVDIAYEANLPIKGGNSGSPVMTLDGEFVGMAVAGTSNWEGYEEPEEPFTHFQGYPPDAMIVPGEWIVERLELD